MNLGVTAPFLRFFSALFTTLELGAARLPSLSTKAAPLRVLPRETSTIQTYADVCTVWNRSAILTPNPSEMRYSVSIDAEFLPSSICDK